MLTRHVVALGRGLVLFALAVAGFGLAVLNVFAALLIILGLVPVHLAAVAAGGKLANRCRRLAYGWGGVEIPMPYHPRPAPPRRRPDGWYEYGDTLYKSPRIPALLLRMRWVREDPATPRDLAWMFLNVFVGGVLALLPSALVAFGVFCLVAPWVWAPSAGSGLGAALLGAAAVAVGVAVGPAALRLHARWTRVLLRPFDDCSRLTPWLGSRVAAVGRCMIVLGLSVAAAAVFVVHLVAYLVAWGPGQPQIAMFSRGLTNTYRRVARDWAGVEIAEPYRPQPGPPEPGPDGRYRYGRSLHRDPRPVVRAQRIEWVLKDRATWRDMLWMLTAPVAGLPLLVLAAVVGYGFFGLIWQPLWWPLWGPALWQFGDVWISPWRAWDDWLAVPFPALGIVPGAVSPAIGVAATAVGLLAAPRLLRLHASWSRLLLAPTERARLAQRVHRLAETRTTATEVQAAEVRRIERDLHDGAQARLVAMGMTLGTIEQLVERDPAEAKALVAKARESSAQALHELRELVRGIHPPVLAERGLADAVRALALDSALPVEVTADLPGRPESPVESAAYFAVSEALANATKHSGADRVWIDLHHDGGALRISVTDDGRGGAAVASSGGLRGMRRRLGTFDGVLTLDSPPGGPTTVRLKIPCALSSPSAIFDLA